MFLAALVMRILDRKEYHSFGKAAWWAVQTVTTVGYGDVTPATAVGRSVAAGPMLVAIAFLADPDLDNRVELRRRRPRDAAPSRPRSPTALRRIEERLDRINKRLDVKFARFGVVRGQARVAVLALMQAGCAGCGRGHGLAPRYGRHPGPANFTSSLLHPIGKLGYHTASANRQRGEPDRDADHHVTGGDQDHARDESREDGAQGGEDRHASTLTGWSCRKRSPLSGRRGLPGAVLEPRRQRPPRSNPETTREEPGARRRNAGMKEPSGWVVFAGVMYLAGRLSSASSTGSSAVQPSEVRRHVGAGRSSSPTFTTWGRNPILLLGIGLVLTGFGLLAERGWACTGRRSCASS